MPETPDITVLCISSYFKGEAFMRAAKNDGARVFLLTEEKLTGENWPRESIDEIFLMPDLTKLQDVTNAVSYLCRANHIDLIIPLDEYDVETVAFLREHLRVPGMGQTATRNFRDKLVMREQAHKSGIRVPPFTKILNYDQLREFMASVPPPWVLKPRTEAGSMGIKKISESEQLWRWLDQLGDRQSYFLLEQYVPGDVYHVDSIVNKGKVIFASVQKYGQPPMDVAHGGGVFTTRTLAPDSDEAKALKSFNSELISALGMEHGVTHAEYIKGHADGQFYFLEIAARVGGAHISDLIEAATGLNPWAEWARLEIAIARGKSYKLPKTRKDYGGLLVCLARQEFPDMAAYDDAEVVWKMHKAQHAGLIVVSPKADRVQSLISSYVERFGQDFLAVAPAKDSRPTH
jgi:biotin carboxylase